MMLKPYMAWLGEDPSEWALLVFAHTAREAKKVVWPELNSFDGYSDFTDARVKWQKNKPHLMQDADPEKLKNGEPHVNDCPTGCKRCYMWGEKIDSDGLCESCLDRRKMGYEE